jgi:hypothetical protein
VTVDGTDFRMREPKPFSKKWFTHKFNGPGVRYEVGVCIATGDIVWLNGPFPCGPNPDINIFRYELKHRLQHGERVEADGGYGGEPLYISTPDDYKTERQKVAKTLARARHEQINRLFKRFQCLLQTFRHKPEYHDVVFRAVAVIVQLSIQYKETSVWQVDYTGDTFADNLFT